MVVSSCSQMSRRTDCRFSADVGQAVGVVKGERSCEDGCSFCILTAQGVDVLQRRSR